MARDYTKVSPVGQINDKACWAASLKWWYKAVKALSTSQTKLWNRYKHLRSTDGGMPDSPMQHIINANEMIVIPFSNAETFTPEELQQLLWFGPVYTAYTESGTHKKHVNVIYGLTSTDPWAEVLVMEPQAKKGSGSGWIGKHQRKSISDFNMIGSVYAGVDRAAFTEVALAE